METKNGGTGSLQQISLEIAFSPKNDIKAQYLLSTGDVEKEIIKVKNVWGMDMIITGGSLYKKFEDYISSSLADKILIESRIPVLFVR